MQYDIRETNGQFEVVVIEARVIGTFADSIMAVIFKNAMYGRATGEAIIAAPCTPPDLLANLVRAASPAPLIFSPVPVAGIHTPTGQIAPEPQPAPPKSIDPDFDLSSALDRVAAGEKLGVVATSLGLTFSFLRSKWAHDPRSRKVIFGSEACRICERQFMPAAGADGRCARCSKEG